MHYEGATCSIGHTGSVFVSGSNPNADYNTEDDVKYKTEYRTERFYPSYYNERRPQPVGLPQQLFYGGPSFDVTLDSDDLFNNVDNIKNTAVVIIRTGFSTHSMVQPLPQLAYIFLTKFLCRTWASAMFSWRTRTPALATTTRRCYTSAKSPPILPSWCQAPRSSSWSSTVCLPLAVK